MRPEKYIWQKSGKNVKCLLSIKQEETMNLQTIRVNGGRLTMADAATMLGVEYSTFYDAVRSGLVPAPTHKIKYFTRRYYTAGEVEELKHFFKEE
jgi:predicted transcriptional regulator